ncbi:unnamed protein product, partial [Gulo gulo]
QDNSTLTIRPVRKEDAGNYQCEVSNPGDSRKSDPIRLAVSYEGNTTGLPVGSIIGFVAGVLVGLALAATLGCLLLCTRTGRASGWCDLRELCCPAPTPRHIPASSNKSQVSLPPPPLFPAGSRELRHPDTNTYCQINYKAEMTS